MHGGGMQRSSEVRVGWDPSFVLFAAPTFDACILTKFAIFRRCTCSQFVSNSCIACVVLLFQFPVYLYNFQVWFFRLLVSDCRPLPHHATPCHPMPPYPTNRRCWEATTYWKLKQSTPAAGALIPKTTECVQNGRLEKDKTNKFVVIFLTTIDCDILNKTRFRQISHVNFFWVWVGVGITLT